VDLLLNAQTLRCKANLRTRAQGLDELVGDLATQSVYVDIRNPFAARAAGNTP
jgi:siderophore synthetase component